MDNNDLNLRKPILSMTLNDMEDVLIKNNFKKYRAKQIYEWIYKHKVDSFDSMNNIPKQIRQYLSENYNLLSVYEIDRQDSKNGETTKLLLELPDRMRIECVIIRSGDRKTLCISSQVGCPLDCLFCATAKMGFIRNLTVDEIVSQLMYALSIEGNIDNIVFMGMGEPLLNYDEVKKTISIINDPQGLNTGIRRITLSTAGVIKGIERLISDELNIRLAVSLNSAINEKRNMLMPINKSNPLKNLLQTLFVYQEKTGKRFTFEYVMIEGVNMNEDDANAIIDLSKNLNFNLNIIPYNKVNKSLYKPDTTVYNFTRPSEESISKFLSYFKYSDIEIVQRYKKGDDISAACGQLATNFEKQ